MLVILAPARNTRLVSHPEVCPQPPLFPIETLRLVNALRELAPWQLESILDVDDRRALEFYEHYRAFDPAQPGTPALLANWGAAYRQIDALSMNAEDWAFAQARIRILSALYGMLRPLDGVLPHRLGLDRTFQVEGRDMYGHWGDLICRELYATGQVVVNLASVDYARLITPHMKPDNVMINCRFKVQNPDGVRGTVATIRMARGQMTRYIIDNRIDRPEGLKDFALDGYRFIPGGSEPRDYLFIKERYFTPCPHTEGN